MVLRNDDAFMFVSSLLFEVSFSGWFFVVFHFEVYITIIKLTLSCDTAIIILLYGIIFYVVSL